MSDGTWQSAYVNQYEDYARTKASYYSDMKFRAVTPWGWSNARREKVILDSVNQLLRATEPGGVVADVGCASGHTLLTLAQSNPSHRFIGLDVARSFVDQAAQSAQEASIPNATFQTTDADSVSLPSGSVSGIILAEVLEHVPDPAALLTECTRTLGSGGWLLMSTPMRNGDGTLWGSLCRWTGVRTFTPASDPSAQGTQLHGDQHLHEFSARTLAETVSNAGLRVSAIKSSSRVDGPGYSLYARVMVREKRLLKFADVVEDQADRWGSLLGSRQLFLLARKEESYIENSLST